MVAKGRFAMRPGLTLREDYDAARLRGVARRTKSAAQGRRLFRGQRAGRQHARKDDPPDGSSRLEATRAPGRSRSPSTGNGSRQRKAAPRPASLSRSRIAIATCFIPRGTAWRWPRQPRSRGYRSAERLGKAWSRSGANLSGRTVVHTVDGAEGQRRHVRSTKDDLLLVEELALR